MKNVFDVINFKVWFLCLEMMNMSKTYAAAFKYLDQIN